MAQTIATFDTAHGGPLHDAQLDYYGKRLATCSSDHLIRIWDVSATNPQFLAELRGHEGPVWQVAWAHPQFGNVLASCSYDHKVFVWKETAQGGDSWKIIYKNEVHCASVNGIAFCPWEHGLQLAAGSSDGTISVMSHCPDHSWYRKAFSAHPHGVNAVSWAPLVQASAQLSASSAGSGKSMALGPLRLASGGCDNMVRIWVLDSNSNEWVEEHRLGIANDETCEDEVGMAGAQQAGKTRNETGHTEWVRDVAWRPSVGLPSNTVTSCSEDKTVIIWSQESESSPWQVAQVLDFEERVWRVSWSVTGTILAVASGGTQVSLYKENLNNRWERLTAPSAAQTGVKEDGWPWGIMNASDTPGIVT